MFKALAWEPRLEILEQVLDEGGFLCVCEIDAVEKDRSVIYRHFRRLENARLIHTKKNGRRVEGRVRKPERVRKILALAEEVS